MQKNRSGPCVKSDVMENQQQNVLFGSATNQPRPHQEVPGKVERLASKRSPQPLQLRRTGFSGHCRQIASRQRTGFPRSNDLSRLAIPGRKSGTQNFMSAGQFVQGSFQSLGLQAPGQAEKSGAIVGWRFRFKLPEEPETFLGEGERNDTEV